MSKRAQKKSLKKQQDQAAAAAASGAFVDPYWEQFYHPQNSSNPNYKVTWPRDDAEKYDHTRFVCVWPSNLNKNKTLALGRRVPKESACDDPIAAEMSEVCQYFKLTHVIEPYKCFPRDWTCVHKERACCCCCCPLTAPPPRTQVPRQDKGAAVRRGGRAAEPRRAEP